MNLREVLPEPIVVGTDDMRFSFSRIVRDLISALHGSPGVCSTCNTAFQPDPKYPAYDRTCDNCAEDRLAL